jgi:NADH-quinone oxidoreductase subunit G
MVVYTRTDRVIEAQNAVVEFLLVNHPLDCPVCDKGGECPLQDIAMGWGPGRSRFTEPKRHFRKPVPLSPLVRIDRERCILCYRCVRFSQEVAEDEQLQLLERGAASYVGTFDDRPYIAPFHGNIIELCPVGALTSEAYRFRARPWDIEDAGSICTLCPSQCNVKHTVRDERVERVLARDNPDVDDGWLCDKGRFGFQMIASDDRIAAPRVGGNRAAWESALAGAAERLQAAGERTAVIVGGQSSNEEGYLAQRIARRAIGSEQVATDGVALDPAGATALSRPELGAAVADLDRAESILVVGCDPLHAMPILELRIRKAIRRGARVVVASERPTGLDGGAEETARYAPGDAAVFLTALGGQLDAWGGESAGAGDDRAAGYRDAAERIGGELRHGSTVIVWGERIGRGPRGVDALAALLVCAEGLELGADGAGLIGVPDGANGRGLREVGCAGGDPEAIRDALAAGDLDAVLLVNCDPVRDMPGGPAWSEALRRARTVIAVSAFTNATAAAADIVFPAEAYAEKEGTVTHPDGRLQRLRPSVPHPAEVRPTWQVLTELAAGLGHETGIDSAPEALAAIAADVAIYAGLTHEEIGRRGIRWQEREAARGAPATGHPPPEARPGAGGDPPASANSTQPPSADARSPSPSSDGLRLGTYRDLWAGEVTERNAALRFLVPSQRLELSTSDAERLGVGDGDPVEVRSNGTSVRARAALRDRVSPGSVFLIEGTATDNATALIGAETVEISRIGADPAAPGREAEEAAGQ